MIVIQNITLTFIVYQPIRNVELEINREKPAFKRPEALSYVNVVDNNSYTKQKLIIMDPRHNKLRL